MVCDPITESALDRDEVSLFNHILLMMKWVNCISPRMPLVKGVTFIPTPPHVLRTQGFWLVVSSVVLSYIMIYHRYIVYIEGERGESYHRTKHSLICMSTVSGRYN